MKSSTFSIVALLLPLVAGNAIRGAAERAMLFYLYVLEEVWTESSEWNIATGCTGTRTGTRGQQNRCDFLEFCDHLWTPTPGNVVNSGNQPAKDANGNLFAEQDASKLAQIIMQASRGSTTRGPVYQPSPPGETWYRPKPSYTGFLAVGNVLDGYTDYYDTMRWSGGNHYLANKKLEELLKQRPPVLKGPEERAIKRALAGASNAAKYVLDLRLSDEAKWRLKATPPPDFGGQTLTQLFNGNRIVPETITASSPFASLKSWQAPSDEKTIAANFGAPPKPYATEAEARTAWQAAKNAYESQPIVQDHLRAIESAKANARWMDITFSC
ncbi:hypothetical protein Micbo1qcDRAFT_179282 [Microdochium bolleyi]|uniref:Uncharacterized protein n=1 Tax=Microdochium bolleyi TaxID=196109 RepID=A0A136IQ27_9PEZI|nr:hypothetical protein Micbo1qcDRAFT_179282 [Microdochium bolleyi]